MSTIGSIEMEHLRNQQIEKGGKWAHWDASRRDTGAKERQEEEVQVAEIPGEERARSASGLTAILWETIYEWMSE